MAELLLEIGFEEMPASWLPGLAEQLAARFTEAASRERIEPAGAEADAALALLAAGRDEARGWTLLLTALLQDPRVAFH